MIQHLSICEEIEQLVGEVYLVLAEQYPVEHELNRIWTEMAAEEMDHARLLQFAKRLDHDKTYEGSTLDLDQLGQLLVQVREVKELAELRIWSEEDAVGIMLNLEEEFSRVHARFALDFKDASMQDMFEKLGIGDELHVEKLKTYQQGCS